MGKVIENSIPLIVIRKAFELEHDQQHILKVFECSTPARESLYVIHTKVSEGERFYVISYDNMDFIKILKTIKNKEFNPEIPPYIKEQLEKDIINVLQYLVDAYLTKIKNSQLCINDIIFEECNGNYDVKGIISELTK